VKTCRAQINGFAVKSLANGDMLVQPDYKSKWTEEDGGGPGLLSRLSIATEIEAVLRLELHKKLPTAAEVRGILRPRKRRGSR